MSGPKSSRYQLTPEQRKALEEARKKELKRRQGLKTLEAAAKALKDSLAPLEAFLEKASLLAARTHDDLGFSQKLSAYTEKVAAAIAHYTPEKDADADTVERLVKEVKLATASLKSEELTLVALAATVEETLDASLNASLAAAKNTSFADIDEEKEERDRRIAYRRELLMAERIVGLPTALLCAIREALFALSNTQDTKTFKSLHYLPLMKEIEAAKSELLTYEADYRRKYAEYRSLCALCHIEPLAVDCSEEGIALLDRYIKTLSYEIAYDDEESYINDVLDRVMREMGYHVLAERTVDKKSGKRFSHELYTYHDGTVVNVTTADDGKITMEIGKADEVDRLPTESETRELCREMEAFCRDFAEIEERLKAYGVVVADRITMLPPSAEHAQIINVGDYTKTEARTGEAEGERSAWQNRLLQRRRVFRSHNVKKKE